MGLEHSMNIIMRFLNCSYNDIHHPNPLPFTTTILSYKRTATNFLSAMHSKAADWWKPCDLH